MLAAELGAQLIKLGALIGRQNVHDFLAALGPVGDGLANLRDLLLLGAGQTKLCKKLLHLTALAALIAVIGVAIIIVTVAMIITGIRPGGRRVVGHRRLIIGRSRRAAVVRRAGWRAGRNRLACISCGSGIGNRVGVSNSKNNTAGDNNRTGADGKNKLHTVYDPLLRW